MATFRKIDPRIWNDKNFRELTDDGQLAFLFFLTHPNLTMVGAMRASVAGLADEKGWTIDRMTKAYDEAFTKGLLKADTRASFIYAPNFIKYNPPQAPNVIKAWPKAFDLLPECDFRDELLQGLKAFVVCMGEGFIKAFTEAFQDSLPNPKPKPKQEQKKKPNLEEGSDSGLSSLGVSDSASGKIPSAPVAALWWNDHVFRQFGMLSPSDKITFDQMFNQIWTEMSPERWKQFQDDVMELVMRAKKKDKPKAWFTTMMKKEYGVVFQGRISVGYQHE